MSLELRLILAATVALAVVYRVTPVAIRIADRFEFYDHPGGTYKGHGRATPYLGGAAVMAGFVTAVVLFAGNPGRTLPVLGGAAVLWAIGTTDDRRHVSPGIRVMAEIVMATILWSAGLGWDLGIGSGVDLALTVFWVVAVVNAINLFDNMDGQASTIAGVIAGGVAVLGVITDDVWVAVAGGALCGACVGFLRYNLAQPPRIFLGDGGSMPIGFSLAALVMIGANESAAAGQALVMGLLFVGVPALDTALVIVSRRRRGISVLTGGRDHLTHRSRERLRTASAVAFALGGSQALLAAMTLFSYQNGSVPLLAAVVVYVFGAGIVIALMDRRPDVQDEEALEIAPAGPPAPAPAMTSVRAIPWEAAVLVPIAAVIAASPWHFSFYASTIWAPAGLVLLVILMAVWIARPASITVPAGIALGSLFGLALWALLSSAWAESAHRAVLESDRLLVYGILLALLLLLVRDSRTAAVIIGATWLGVMALVLRQYIHLAGDTPASLFLGGRLHDPLGYINGLGTYLVLGLWPAIALAEQRRWPALSGVGMACAALIAPLLLLTQSRGVALAVTVSAAVVFAVVPGRLRRVAVVALLGACAAVMVSATNALYTQGLTGVVSTGDAHRVAERAVIVAVASGILWWIAVAAFERLRRGGADRVASARRAAIATLAFAALLVGIIGIASADRIADNVSTQYNAFVHLSVAEGGEATSSRLFSGAGNRFDYWKIAVRIWRDAPLVGVGAGSYPVRYFAERTTAEDIRQPHSIELQALSELGIVGALLLLGMLGAVLVAGVRRAGRARTSLMERWLLVAALGVFVGWLVHTSVDWMHLLPGVTAVALCAAAVLLRPGEGGGLAPEPAAAETGDAARRRWARLVPAALAVFVLLAAGALLGRLVLTERYAERAQDALAKDPGAALRDANRALRLDGTLITAYYTKAAALARFGDARGSQAALLKATRQEPSNFVTWALLGDLSVRKGDLAAAKRYYGTASRLNPRDTGLAQLARDPAAGQ